MIIKTLIALIIVLLTVGAILGLLYGPDKFVDKIKRYFTGQVEQIPDASNQASVSKEMVSQEHKAEISALKNVIQVMLKSDKKNCFTDFGGFSDLQGMSLSLEFDSQNSDTEFKIFGGAGGKQFVSDLTFRIDNMVPCVIAGKEVTESFDKSFLNKEEGVFRNHFSPVNQITIAWNDAGLNENRINHGSGFKDFEGSEFLYTPDNKHICFFPTVDTWTDEDGLNDDYFDRSKDSSIPHKMQEGTLVVC